MIGHWAIFKNLIAGARLALMLPVRRNAFGISIDQAVLLVLVSLVVSGLAEFALTAPPRTFNSYGLGYGAAECLTFFFGLYLIARIQGVGSSATDLVVILSSVTPVVAPAMVFLLWLGDRADTPASIGAAVGTALTAVAAVVWIMAIFVRAFRLVFTIRIRRVVFLILGFLAIFYGTLVGVPEERLWYSAEATQYEEEDDPYERINIENTYRAQRDLLNDAFAGLLPQREGTTDLYFAGFGSYAYEDVFLKEVRIVRELFDERFGTRGRSVALINNLSTLEDVPLASLGNLEDVLDEMGSRMNVEEDVLFLFLTSHGSRKQVFSVDFWPLGLNDMTPEILREILDGSGIKWRVIVVSACYSGGFIDALRNDFTLVMTAARSDQMSFGCDSLSEFTYFGKAYFDEALREQNSFVEGFYSARQSIFAREQKEDLVHSWTRRRASHIQSRTSIRGLGGGNRPFAVTPNAARGPPRDHHAPFRLFPADAQRNPFRGGDRLAPADAARRHGASGQRRNLLLAAARLPGAREDRADRARGAGPCRCPGGADADHPVGRPLAPVGAL